jgi:hypothetical protein
MHRPGIASLPAAQPGAAFFLSAGQLPQPENDAA